MELEGKQFEALKWVLVLIAIYMVYKLLNKFGLLGETSEEKEARELSENSALKEFNKENKLMSAAKKTLGTNKPSAEQLKSLMPNKANFGRFAMEIKAADGNVNDDETAVYNVFNSMYSQFEISAFATVYKVLYKMDLFTYLNSFLDEKELANVQRIIKNKKPA